MATSPTIFHSKTAITVAIIPSTNVRISQIKSTKIQKSSLLINKTRNQTNWLPQDSTNQAPILLKINSEVTIPVSKVQTISKTFQFTQKRLTTLTNFYCLLSTQAKALSLIEEQRVTWIPKSTTTQTHYHSNPRYHRCVIPPESVKITKWGI